MIFFASAMASANDWVSTAPPRASIARQTPCQGLRQWIWARVERVLETRQRRRSALSARPAVRGELQAGGVLQRHHHLVGADVAGVRDPPDSVLAAGVPVLVKRRAFYQDAVLGGDNGVLEGPGAAGRGAVDVDLRLAREVHRDDAGPEALAEELDDRVAAGEPDRLAEGPRAVVHGGVLGEHLADLVPQLEVDAAEVAVFHPA